MHLQTISLINFKNIKEASVSFSRNLNCFVGDNGAGKTNVIDAIYYLSMCKSAFNLTDGQSVNHSSDFFVLEGNYALGSSKESVYCGFKRGNSKTVKRGGKEYEKLSEHIGLLPVVLVSPSDTSLINESGDDRRKFINALLSQLDREYLNTLIKYNRLLAERNKLLKSSSTSGFGDVLEILDMQLAPCGAYINARRAEMAAQLSPLAARYYAELAGGGESISITYKSELNETPMEQLLKNSLDRDRAMQHTTTGIHRDDLQIDISGYPLRKFGSQGQQKSFLVALKLAQAEIVHEGCGCKPLLLLDDIFDKLDIKRVEKLIQTVSQDKFGQIFITDSNKVRLGSILESIDREHRLFAVEAGKVTEIETEKS